MTMNNINIVEKKDNENDKHISRFFLRNKIYLDNMYFLKEIDNDKVIFLNKLKKELDDNKLLIYNPLFKKYILNQEITIYGKDILTKEEKLSMIEDLTKEMKEAAGNLDFERAMQLRDIIFELESE